MDTLVALADVFRAEFDVEQQLLAHRCGTLGIPLPPGHILSHSSQAVVNPGQARPELGMVVKEGLRPPPLAILPLLEAAQHSLCPHARPKADCKDCSPAVTGKSAAPLHSPAIKKGGRSTCVHGRQRCRCKICGGGSICPHGRRRTVCKECGGSEFCQHGRRRSICQDCGGGSMCEHGRRRIVCKLCKGSGICEHNRVRRTCKQCLSASLAGSSSDSPTGTGTPVGSP